MVSVKRPEVANRIHDAKEHGDLSENAEYEDAKNEQAFVEGRIQTLEALIKNATIIDENHSTDHVQIGSTVAVESPDGKEALHDRRLRRGQARRGPDLEREPGRARPARQEEGREGRRQGPGRRLHLQDRRHHLDPRRSHGLGGRTRGPGQRPAGRQRFQDAVGDGPRREPARTRHPRRHRPRPACERARDHVAVRRRRPRPDGRPGAPDPGRDRPRDGPPAGPRPRSGRRLPRELRPSFRGHLHRRLRRARHPAGSLLLDERHLPDGRDGSVHPAGSRPGGARARDLPSRRQRPAPGDVASDRRHLPDVRQGRDDDRDRLGRRQGLLRMPPRPRDLGARLRLVRLDQPVRREREAALEPRMGGAMVALRRDHRTGRQGPLDRWRLARPERRHRPRGVRARAAAQRPLRVPQHRRQEDVDLEGPGRCRPHDRRGHPAGAAPVPVPAAAPQPGDRVRSGRDRCGAAPVRRVRQVRRGDGRP